MCYRSMSADTAQRRRNSTDPLSLQRSPRPPAPENRARGWCHQLPLCSAAQDFPDLGQSTRLLGVRNASGLLRPGLHQIGRHDEIENLIADLDCPAALAWIIARGTRDPRPSVNFVTTREVPVGRDRPALLAVQGVGIPFPPVAANGDNRVPCDGRRPSGGPPHLPRGGLRCCSDDRLWFTFLRLRYRLGDVRGSRGCSRRGGSKR